MEKAFLEGYNLEEAQMDEILGEVRKEVMRAHLSAKAVRSLSAAEAVLSEADMGDLTPEQSVEKLLKEHPYLFNGEAAQFTGPAGSDNEEDETDSLRKALGLV